MPGTKDLVTTQLLLNFFLHGVTQTSYLIFFHFATLHKFGLFVELMLRNIRLIVCGDVLE